MIQASHIIMVTSVFIVLWIQGQEPRETGSESNRRPNALGMDCLFVACYPDNTHLWNKLFSPSEGEQCTKDFRMNPQTSTTQSVPPLVPITSGSAVQGTGGGGGGAAKPAVPCKTLQETIKAIENQIGIMEKLGSLTAKQEGDLTKLRELHQKALQEQERLRVEKMHVSATPIHQQPNSATQAIKSIASSSNNNSNVQLGASGSSTSSHSLHHSSSSIRDAPRESPISMSIGADIGGDASKILNKKKIQDLVREVDPNTQLDEDVEEMLLQIADDFIENIVTAGCQLAKHRKSSTLEVKDILMHLERNWNMWIPGYTPEEPPKAHKRPASTEAHKQRMALIRKTLKK